MDHGLCNYIDKQVAEHNLLFDMLNKDLNYIHI
jgi:hypothetical protein